MSPDEVVVTESRSKGAEIAIGILLVILGLISISIPFIASAILVIALGWLFIIGGIFRIFYAFRDRQLGDFWVKLFLGALQLILGILLLSKVLIGILSIVLAIGIFVFIEGCLEVILAFKIRPAQNWGWVLLSGVITVILGILILNLSPVSALSFLGLLVGINFLISGIWNIVVALRKERPRRDLA